MKRKDFIKTSAGMAAGSFLLSSFQVPSTNQKLIPKALMPNDTIALTAPSGSIWNKSHISKIEKLMADWGFKTVIGQSCYEQDGFLAGSDQLRAAELMHYFEDKSVKAILTMRGGWGCGRILDTLDYDIIRSNPKIVMGFSDITSLVNAIYVKTGLVTYHGPCGYSSWGDFTKKMVTKSLISGAPFSMKNPAAETQSLKTLTAGKASGELVGGNLTVIQSMIGTEYEPNWNDKILFLEEIGEEAYRVDRMLWQLKQRGVFQKVNGVVLGSFRDCEAEEAEKSFSLQEIFDQHFAQVGFPVYQGATFGHLAPKFTLPIGINAEIDADNFTIRTLEKSVS
ncbi:MAG: LD-carboxypeptidase [Flavobacteriales bacterium]|nr:LD-carboxypeptidase [Flavobacteriales bacterium]